jgi:hypothetical protein
VLAMPNRRWRGTVAAVSKAIGSSPSADALLGLLDPAWQALIAGCLLVVTVLGVIRLAARGPARMTNGVLVTGALIVAITVIGTVAVSCSQDSAQAGSDLGR